MNTLLRIIITAILVTLLSFVMRGVHVNSYLTAFFVAVVLGLLNIFIKPLIVLLTLPVTIFTLGLFLLVINASMILLCTKIVGGFEVTSFWHAILFSMVLSLCQSLAFSLLPNRK